MRARFEIMLVNHSFRIQPIAFIRDDKLHFVEIGAQTAEMPYGPSGDSRAYDARTGKKLWQFHTIPQPGETGAETWPNDSWRYLGGANSWAGVSLDSARGVVYVPTGSASPSTTTACSARPRTPTA